MMRYALIILMFLADPIWAGQPPQHVQMEFAVTSGAMHLGDGRDVLEHDGKQYSVISELKTVGLAAIIYKLNIRRESRGLITKNGLRPLHFEEDRTKKPKRAADFDWDTRQIKLTDGANIQTVPLPEGTFDQTSFAYAFAFRPPSEEILPVYLTDGRKLSDYKYRFIGKEKLKTPLGELETVHFKKIQEADDKRGFDVWLAVAHHYLPVRIHFVETNGTALDSIVTAISYP
jgi:hypothetical protein